MAKGYMKSSEQKKVFIKTKPFYVKYAGMIDFECEALLNQETEKAVLVRYWNGNNFTIKPIWIPKSKLIEMRELEVLENKRF